MKHLLHAIILGFILQMTMQGQEGSIQQTSTSQLRPGDTLQISVFRAPEFDRSVRVEEDGFFSFPLCGEIEAANHSPREVARFLEEKLSTQLADPHVDIFVTHWGPRTVYLLGEFRSGSMSKELPTYGRLTALQAISAAGGFSESADLANVAILRQNKTTGKYERIPVDVSVLLGNAGVVDECYLMPEDTLLAPRAAVVLVSGQVNNPTLINIETKRPPHLSELVVRAGGLKNGANIDSIAIIRTLGNGERTTLIGSLRSTEPGIYENDPIINPGDHVLVPAADSIFVTGSVANPRTLDLPPETIVTVSQAITLAGGFKNVASQSNVVVIRGSERIRVDLSKLYAKAGNLENDLPLQYGDIVFVPESFW